MDMGETSLDEETFNEYIEEMRDHYTADKVGCAASSTYMIRIDLVQYHLLGTFTYQPHLSLC